MASSTRRTPQASVATPRRSLTSSTSPPGGRARLPQGAPPVFRGLRQAARRYRGVRQPGHGSIVPAPRRRQGARGSLRVSCHIETAADFRNALAADVDEINHLPGYFAEGPRLERFVITRDDAALAARKHTVVVTTTYVSTAQIKDPKELTINREVQVKNLRTLHDAQVEIALGPDVYGVTALAEAMNVHELGVFDNLTLLKMWSESSARTIFPTRKIGRLAEGYEASFLVLGGDPVARFENVKDIRVRFKQGVFITPTANEPAAQ